MGFSREITLEQMMTEWPQTVTVLMRYRMLCVGCPISSFHTPIDAAREHLADLEALERDLVASVRGGQVEQNRNVSSPLCPDQSPSGDADR